MRRLYPRISAKAAWQAGGRTATDPGTRTTKHADARAVAHWVAATIAGVRGLGHDTGRMGNRVRNVVAIVAVASLLPATATATALDVGR